MYRALLNEVRGLIENSPAIDRDGRWHSDMAHQSSDEGHPPEKQDRLHRVALDANRAELAKEKDNGTRRVIKDRIKGHAAHLGIKDSDEPESEAGAAVNDLPRYAPKSEPKTPEQLKRELASIRGKATKTVNQNKKAQTQARRAINKANKAAAPKAEPEAKAESLQVIREWAGDFLEGHSPEDHAEIMAIAAKERRTLKPRKQPTAQDDAARTNRYNRTYANWKPGK